MLLRRSLAVSRASMTSAVQRRAMGSDTSKKLNKFSSVLTENKSHGAAQAMLYATGLKEDDITKPQVGIASVWWEGNPCNMHLLDLAQEIKTGVQDAGLVGYRFNTIGVSDGIAQYELLHSSLDFDTSLPGSCPGPGACGGMYTANTMATAIEVLGLSLPYSSSSPAESQDKIQECRAAGRAIRYLMENDIKPKDILTRESFQNAIAVTMALGGSTNAVLHFIAIARAAGVDLTLDDFNDVAAKTPYLANLRPSGKYVMEDLHQYGQPLHDLLVYVSCRSAGGVPAVIKYLLEKGLLNGDCLTVTGKSLAENVAGLPGLTDEGRIIHPVESPLKPTGHIRVLRGNLAPEGAVAKITGKEGEHFTGKALVYDCEEDMLKALEDGEITKGSVIVIRYEGPKGGPGMPEM
ncbi:hypothetical protein DYB32_004372 [Aphanomyces invadans]|uniref:Dihydroxy-acid dehydratase n=1 Tax=Aphanomyces invadans TaxID=157072 RepID=A0A418AXU1_9STRA|nr:hypothetical protein DYB32_004372 [Aphanomyces invadans]